MHYDNIDKFNSMSFTDSCNEMSLMIDDVKSKYLEIFNLKSLAELIAYFSYTEIESNTVCAKKMSDIGGWRCQDCAIIM